MSKRLGPGRGGLCMVAWLAVVAATVLGTAGVARANQLVTITVPDSRGEIPAKWLSYAGPPRAEVLLPDDFNPRRAYPLLIVLPGFGNTYAVLGDPGELDAQKVLAGLRAIVVAPEGGTGWYADWWNNGAYGTPGWESYILDEVIPQILRRYEILPQRRYHALFGVSMGGLGAAYLAGRLPGFFGSIGILSGFVDPQLTPTIGSLMDAFNGVPAGTVVGPESGFYATGHNPARLTVNLEHTRVFMSAGDGTPTPGEGTGGGLGNAEEAGVIRPMSDAYASALRAAGIDLVYHTHAGCHCWPDFQAELRDAVAWGPFKPVVERPTVWVNDTAATRGQLWDIAYRFDRPPSRLVRFRRSGDSLAISTAGSDVTITAGRDCLLHVATPADMRMPSRTCAPNRRRHRGHGRGRAARDVGKLGVSAARTAAPLAWFERARREARRGRFAGWEKEITHVTGAGEPEIAVGSHGGPLLVAFNSCGVAVSRDRGATFAVGPKNPADPGPMPGDPYHSCSDPVAALGPRDVLYTGAGYWDQPGGYASFYNMYVARSADGGARWSEPVFVTGDRDKRQRVLPGRSTAGSDRLFLTVDAGTGTVYGTATDLPRLVRWVVASHDGGARFGPPHAIGSALYPQVQGDDDIPAAANGAVAFAYVASAAPGTTCPCGIFETSRDDGATWIRHLAPFPATWVAADPSHRGRFAIMSGQGVTATAANPGYVTVSTTSNDGRSWTKPVLIGQPPLHPRIQPWIAYSPTGVLGVGYKTLYTGLIPQSNFLADALTGNVPGNYDYWTAVSFDDGRTFSRPLRVSNAVSPPGNAGGNDDFSSVALDDHYLYAAWGDRRTSPTNPAPGPVSVYFARVPFTAYFDHQARP